MTEESARHYAKELAQGMGITFYAVRSREGRYLVVQVPSEDCEILVMVTPPGTGDAMTACIATEIAVPIFRRLTRQSRSAVWL